VASTTVRGTKPARQWLQLLADENSPLYAKLADVYGGADLVAEPAETCRRAVEAFAEWRGEDAGAIIVRATGRINLMGMHIDHRGGSVNPIAIKEVFFVAEPRNDDRVVLRSAEAGEFPEEGFVIHECLPHGKIRNWDSWSHDELDKRKDDPNITWSNYVRAAVLYLQHVHTTEDGEFEPALHGMNVMVNGNIPRAAGLSTSSSIVVASAEACIRINDLKVEPMDFIDICGYGEWYVGTRGGSGDHAAIKFGRPNAILHMTSLPLSVETVPFPPGYRIVLANSLVEARKQAGARDAFNNRVASYLFGLMLARKSFPRHAPRMERLRDITPACLGVSQAEIYRIIKAMPETASREDVLRVLADEEKEVRHIFRSHAEPGEGYKIRQVCMYGITECIRADMAADRLKAGDVKGFGELINISHDADRVTRVVDGERVPTDNSYPDARMDALIADAESGDPARVERARLWRQPGGYDVSVPEIDILVDIALDAPGVIGAGLVGAGLGGSMIALVEEAHADELVERMAEDYYRPRDLPVKAEIVAPVGGAGVMDV